MPTGFEIAWLAGLIDGEGCIAFMRRTDYAPKHRLEVRYDVKIAMTCEMTIRSVYELLLEIVGDDLVRRPYEEKRKVRRRRPLWRVEVSSKRGVYELLQVVLPHLRTKRLEARLCVRYLERALLHKRYRADDYDRQLAEVATDLRNGRRGARAEAKELLSQVILSQAEGSTTNTSEGAEIRTATSATSNRSHERPAPHPQKAEGEDMIRSPEETPGEGINGPQPFH